MSMVWLACCAAEELPAVEGALLGIDPSSQVLRLGDMADVLRMLSAFEGAPIGVAVTADRSTDELERILRGISSEGRACAVVVLLRCADDVSAQRLMGAGATEVIGVDGAPRGLSNLSPNGDALAGGVLQGDAPAEEAPSTPVAPGAAPIVTVASGRGGCGKTILAAAVAWSSAQLGLRTALVDADLAFGNAGRLFGADMPPDLGLLAQGSREGVRDEDVERTALRVSAGLTLWGPCAAPEAAELAAARMEPLLRVLQRESDVVVVDTSAAWGEATAAPVALCDRCLMMVDRSDADGASLRRAVDLAAKLGVSKTRMVCVSNRCTARDGEDDFALRAEMASGLGSRLRVPDAGGEASQMLAVGGIAEVMLGPGPFPAAIRGFAQRLLVELGCPVASPLPEADGALAQAVHGRRRLPWRRGEGR